METESEGESTWTVSEVDSTWIVSEDDSTWAVSEDDSTWAVSEEDSVKKRLIVSLPLPKQRVRDIQVSESSHSKLENSRHERFIGWVENLSKFSAEPGPAYAITIKSPRASVNHDHCSIDSTADVQNRNYTTSTNTARDTNKRARDIEDDGNRRRKPKTARHEVPSNSSKNPSTYTLKSGPAHAVKKQSLRAPVAHDECTIHMKADVQTGSHTASANTARDQNSDNHDARIIMPGAAVHADSNTTQTTKAKDSKSGSGHRHQSPARGMQRHPRLHTEASTAGDEIKAQIMNEFALASHAPIAPVDDQSLESTSKINGAFPACPSVRPEASVRSTSADTISTADTLVCASVPKMSSEDPHILRWKSTPFTLYLIKDNLYCPRLIVKPRTALARVLFPKAYPLDSAVLLIHRHGGLGRSLCCEATRILTVYDEIHRLKYADTNITLLDPDLFKPSYCHSLMEQTTFHNKVRGWIDIIGHGVELPKILEGTWMIKEIVIDYEHLGLSLRLRNGIHELVYPCPPGHDDPIRREGHLQRYRDPSIDPSFPLPKTPDRGMIEDIIFCQYWMKEECDSDEICTVILWRNRTEFLTPYCIDVIGCHLFNGQDTDGLTHWVADLRTSEQQQRKNQFWQDLKLAQEADR